jgi:hypothetical protein
VDEEDDAKKGWILCKSRDDVVPLFLVFLGDNLKIEEIEVNTMNIIERCVGVSLYYIKYYSFLYVLSFSYYCFVSIFFLSLQILISVASSGRSALMASGMSCVGSSWDPAP